MRQAVGQHGLQQIHQQRLIACIGLGAACQLGQREGALGQGFKNQHRGLAAGDEGLHHGRSGIGAVARKACRAANAQVGYVL